MTTQQIIDLFLAALDGRKLTAHQSLALHTAVANRTEYVIPKN